MGRWLALVEERERVKRETESRDCSTSAKSNDQTTQAAPPPPPKPAVTSQALATDLLPCHVCGSTDFWERPAQDGGGLVCSLCHPHPLRLLAEWEQRSDSTPPTVS